MSEATPASSTLMQQLQEENFDWFEAMGRWRGIAESSIPPIVFIVCYSLTQNLWLTAGAATGVSLVFILLRAITRVPLTPALSGFFAVGISVLWMLWSGKGENFFALGMVNAALFALGLTITNLLRRPAVGYAVEMLWKLPVGWRSHPHYAALYQRTRLVTWLWVGMFTLRFLVQLPLWLAGHVELLGTAKLILGLPLFAAVVWLSWTALRPFAAHFSSAAE